MQKSEQWHYDFLPRATSNAARCDFEHLDVAVDKASGGGADRFSQRQLFYVLRPIVMGEFGSELKYPNLTAALDEYEPAHGPIPGIYRDPRGTLYHPHTGESIPLGTIAVEEYIRPAWTFERILYCEKEGLTEILKSNGWPERHDCAIVSSKGFTTRAVRDLLTYSATEMSRSRASAPTMPTHLEP